MKDKVLLTIGTISGGTGLSLASFDLYLALLLKITSLITFLLFIVINQDKIEDGIKKLIRRIK
jgi:hypothetical protein